MAVLVDVDADERGLILIIIIRVHYMRTKKQEKRERDKEEKRGNRVSNENTRSSRLGLGGSNCGFQVPGRLRPSAPIKGRGALRASANLCILLFFLFFQLFSLSLHFFPFLHYIYLCDII